MEFCKNGNCVYSGTEPELGSSQSFHREWKEAEEKKAEAELHKQNKYQHRKKHKKNDEVPESKQHPCDPVYEDCPGDQDWIRGWQPQAHYNKMSQKFTECDLTYEDKSNCFEDVEGIYWYITNEDPAPEDLWRGGADYDRRFLPRVLRP